MVVGFTTICAISTDQHVVSLNPVKGEVYLQIQHYVISLSVTCGRSVVFSGYSTNIAEILLKVALSTINITTLIKMLMPPTLCVWGH